MKQSVRKGGARDGGGRGGGKGQPSVGRAPVGNRSRGSLIRAGRPGGLGGGAGALGNRAVGRMFDAEASAGEPLAPRIRQRMERSFEADFSGVRVVPRSAAASRLGALAVTRGERVHVAPGQLAPGTPTGRSLIGHELAHVIQQRQGRVRATAQAKGVGINQDRALEAEADAAGDRAARGLSAGLSGKGLGRGPWAPVAQCKVGLEFQATGGGTGVAKLEDGHWVRPEHAEVISEEAGFTVETDFDDIEYVTSAVDERSSDAVSGLTGAAGTAAAIHSKITESHDLEAGDLDVAAFEAKADYFQVTAKGSGTQYRLYKAGPKNAHPQATVGIRLDRLGGFLTAMGTGMDTASEDWQTLGYGGSIQSLAGKDEKLASQQKALRDGVARVEAQSATLKELWGGKELSKSAEGFLAMMVQYVDLTRDLGKPKTRNAKNAYAAMGRTSLNAMHAALVEYDRQAIELLMEHGYYAFWREALFGAKLLGSVKVASQYSGQVTLSTVWSEIKAGEHESLSKYSGISDLDVDTTHWSDESDKTPGKKQRYGIKRPTDIGLDTDTDEVHGAILEMRALGRNVAPGKWADVAEAVAKIVKAQNA